MILLRAADRVASPWKNGRGVTREVAVHPRDAALDGFAWRVSLATVHAPGPFSHFPETDRTLAVLEGRMSLTIEGARRELGPESAPIAFPGDVPVEAQIGSDPVTDLNLMTRRGRTQGVIERVRLTAPIEINPSPTTLLFAPLAGLEVTFANGAHTLGALDALEFGLGDAPVRVQTSRSSTAYVIRIMETHGAPRR